MNFDTQWPEINGGTPGVIKKTCLEGEFPLKTTFITSFGVRFEGFGKELAGNKCAGTAQNGRLKKRYANDPTVRKWRNNNFPC